MNRMAGLIAPERLGIDQKTSCRLCLSKVKSEACGIFSEHGILMDISTKIETFLQTPVHQLDNWPQAICQECENHLITYQAFYNSTKSVESILVATFGNLVDIRFEDEVLSSETQLIEIDYGDEVVSNPIVIKAEREVESNEIELEIDNEARPEIELEPENEMEQENNVVEYITQGEEQESDNEAAMDEDYVDDTGSDAEDEEEEPKEKKTTVAMKTEKIFIDDETIAKYVSLVCELCTEVAHSFDALTEHFALKHNGTIAYVRCCGRKYDKRCKLVQHVQFHIDPDIFSCPFFTCDRKFAHKHALTAHKESHVPADDREFKCDLCDKSFTRKYRLDNHKVVHQTPDEHRYFCDQCDRSYASKYVLNSHMKHAHGEPKDFICEVCAKVFKTRDGLKYHMVKHMEKKPPRVHCEICDASFQHKVVLKKHMLIHTRDENEKIDCDECGKTVSSKRALLLHKKATHSDQLFSCTFCSKDFKRAIYLKVKHCIFRVYDLSNNSVSFSI